MIDWEDVAPKLQDVFSRIAPAAENAGTFRARWAEEKAGFVNSKHKGEVILRIASVADVGSGTERRWITDAAGARETFVGQRRVGLEVQCSSFEHVFSTWSLTTAERLRTFLGRDSVAVELLASNIGILNIGPSRDVSFSFDGRRVNAVVFEVTLGIAYNVTDTTETVGTIEHIKLTAKLQGVNGTELGQPTNYTDLLLP